MRFRILSLGPDGDTSASYAPSGFSIGQYCSSDPRVCVGVEQMLSQTETSVKPEFKWIMMICAYVFFQVSYQRRGT